MFTYWGRVASHHDAPKELIFVNVNDLDYNSMNAKLNLMSPWYQSQLALDIGH